MNLAKLSRRERDIFTAIARGDRPKQIADTFGLSVKTVSTYRARVIQKLGITTGNAGITTFAHLERLRVADDHALIAAALVADVAWWMPLALDPQIGDVKVGGARYTTSLDDAGVPILTNLLRDALRVALPVVTRAAA